MYKKYIFWGLILMCSILIVSCGKRISITETQTLSSTTLENGKQEEKSEINWKCIYIGSIIESEMPEIKNQVVFDNEDEWLKFAYDNLPNSIVDVVDKQVNWKAEGIVVLQDYAPKGYFSFLPQVSDVWIEDGLLKVEYEDNTDTSKTYYVRAGYNEKLWE
ncbi:hypothetical protein SAMN02746089_02284 [Caldanaerobius fijiensis DSM 17918]|uniref:Lipoprotein n=1 Tax=Caldanaerobius fijiensis DSM 17918 TaxID=1121256 RepID=A0A1M5D8C6_9THEO|nr:hypothetical protein [Caldanaerobius fijiensis]SHF63137.1 hypothetical protein SAMN02746089_02284 [Caldanaerobius fijiensis DSM 17918]